jgi:hypothetical protein
MRARLIATLVLGALFTTACGGGKSSTTASQTVATPPVKVGASTALRWPKVFCALKPGVSQAQIIQLMGAPTSSGSASSGLRTLAWSAMGYGFVADLNQAGVTITKLEVVADAESSQNPQMTSRLRNCPWL